VLNAAQCRPRTDAFCLCKLLLETVCVRYFTHLAADKGYGDALLYVLHVP